MSAHPRLLQHALQAQAQARPDALALVCGDTRLSYGELDQLSDRLAGLLAELGCCRGDRVALLLPKSPQAIAAMLATLKLGAAYVPLDPAGPAARLAPMLAITECAVVLTAGKLAPMLEAALAEARPSRIPLLGRLDTTNWGGCALGPAFSLHDVLAHGPLARGVGARCGDTDPALILFTSGSTGRPKGVTITHHNVLGFLDWAIPYFGIGPDDRLSQHAPLRFDISTFDIYGALSCGAELHIVLPELNLLPHKLAQFIRFARLTQWFSVPSVLNLMAHADVLWPGDFPSLRRVLFAGEVLPTGTLMHWMRRVPHVRYSNLYGPTETTIASSCHTLAERPADAREPIPIGHACGGEELLLLDEGQQPVADGEIGEIFIRGVGVSPGYWRDPERSAAAFVTLPGPAGGADRAYRTGDLARRGADGALCYVGRADQQVKCRGYRIELGEIELVMRALPGVREAAVVAIDSTGFEGKLLCCAYVPAAPPPSVQALRRCLARQLPAQMLPQRWLSLDHLPANASGKIDRLALAQEFLAAERAQAAGTPAALRRLEPTHGQAGRLAARAAPTLGDPR